MGKSTLFNALVAKRVSPTGEYPFTTIKPHRAEVSVPDSTLEALAQTLKLGQKVPATLEFVDVAGLVKGAHRGEGLGNEFLGHLREVSVLIMVLRGFENPKVPRVKEANSAQEELKILKEELLAADEAHPAAKKLTNKPQLLVVNLNESQVANFESQKLKLPQETLGLSAKLEAELQELAQAEQEAYLESLGLAGPRLPILIDKAFEAAGLTRFFTFSEKLVQAWPIAKGSTVFEAAGKIHSDFQKGFIAAEVIKSDELISLESWQKAKEKGKVAIGGKDYVLSQGEVIRISWRP